MAVYKRNLTIIAVSILIIAIILSSFVYLVSQSPYSGKTESITVAYSPFESLTLFFVAENQQIFSRNGLNVDTHLYDSGAHALNGVLSEEADIAIGTTEFPLVARTFNEEKISAIASITKSEYIYLVARADRGIQNVSDLKGKTIGTTFGTIAQFFLGRFLELNGLNMQDINLVDVKTPADWVNAVVNGSIDAVATAQPYANLAKEGLGDNAVVWPIQSNQPLYALAIATNNWITAHPELVNRFLKSLVQAEEFTLNHPSQVKEIVKNELNFTDEYVDTVWKQNTFSLSLDQSLLLAMQDEARWLISNNLTNATGISNMQDFIYVDGLKAVKQGVVNIIG
jgi:ABC-type nitrate/sulfonate/bicarbonate transport system substrate-binding protein